MFLWPTGMVQVLNGTIDDGYNGLLGWIWIACAVTTIGLVALTWFALKERYYSAVMAATGLLYLAILTAVRHRPRRPSASSSTPREHGRSGESVDGSDDEVLGFGVGDDDRRRRLLGDEVELLGERRRRCGRSRAARRPSPGRRGRGTRGSPTSTREPRYCWRNRPASDGPSSSAKPHSSRMRRCHSSASASVISTDRPCSSR